MDRLAKCGAHQSPEEVFEQRHRPTVPYELALCLELAKNQLYDEGQAIGSPLFSSRISKKERKRR
jgi:hypothetical protein